MKPRPGKPSAPARSAPRGGGYRPALKGIVELLTSARRASARAVNAVMTAAYWEIGRRIVELEQGGLRRAEYGGQVVARLAEDLTARFGTGFGRSNLFQMKAFYLAYASKATTRTLTLEGPPSIGIVQTASGQSKAKSSLSSDRVKVQTLSGQSGAGIVGPDRFELAEAFPLPWSHYVRLISVKSEEARKFYETEALRGGWTVRQLDRQVSTQFYERTALSRDKVLMLRKGGQARPSDALTAEEEIKDPYLLEFLGLKDEYSETDLEEAIIGRLEGFLMELGGDFAFIGRQRRLRVGNEWCRIDLLFYHRRLRCLLVIDVKADKFTHADAGQMHMYLNYARKHWTHPDENPPVGLILCAAKDEALAHYTLEGLRNQVLAAEYRVVLPKEKALTREIELARRALRNATPDEAPPRKPGSNPKKRRA